MKQIKYIIITLTIMMSVWACEDPDAVRVPELEKVVSMRLQIDPDFSIIDALDIPNAILRMDLYTEVKTIDSVLLYVDYFSFSQDSIYSTALVHSFLGSDFGSDNQIESYDLTTQQISDGVGIPVDSMGGGDRLDFVVITVLEDGRRFPDTLDIPVDEEEDPFLNTTPNILNSASTTSLTTSFTTFIACPVEDDFFVGAYAFEQVSGPSDPFFGTGDLLQAQDGRVNIGRVNEISRSFGNLTYATFGGGEIEFLLICDNVIIPYTAAPASCGGGLGWTGDPTLIYTYSEPDDSEILLNLYHNPTGDCGLPVNEPWVFKLTKIEE